MQRSTLLFLAVCRFSTLGAQSLEIKTAGNEKLLGLWSHERLEAAPYAVWFKKNYDAYEPEKVKIKKLRKTKDLFDSVTLFMGTWCGDSKREAPRFIKCMEELSFNLNRLKIICVDRTFQNYKQSPGREESGQNIHRVPTFIFHKNGDEIGRIVESPKESLEVDMLKLVTGGNYMPNYEGVVLLNQLLTDNGVGYIIENKLNILDQLRTVVSSKYELNTYGLVLFSSFQLADAGIIYELNKLLFPNESLPFFSLGRFEAISGDIELARVDLEQALELAPDNEDIKAYLDKIQEP